MSDAFIRDFVRTSIGHSAGAQKVTRADNRAAQPMARTEIFGLQAWQAKQPK